MPIPKTLLRAISPGSHSQCHAFRVLWHLDCVQRLHYKSTCVFGGVVGGSVGDGRTPKARLKVSSSQRSTNTSAWHPGGISPVNHPKSRLLLETQWDLWAIDHQEKGPETLVISLSPLFHFFLLCSGPRLSGCFMFMLRGTHRAPDEQGLFTLHIVGPWALTSSLLP